MYHNSLISRRFQTFTIGVTVVALLLTTLALPWGARPAQAVATKIMPLGDSITGSTCWRAKLWNKLQTNGFTNIDFVGSLTDSGCGVTYDGNNEGHGGYLVTGLQAEGVGGEVDTWLNANNPDIILMHFGTNDVWNQASSSNITSAYSYVVDRARAHNPNVKFIVAQIIPLNPRSPNSPCATCPAGVTNLNATIPAWASGKTTGQSPITVVDQWTGFDVVADTVDGVHPNDTTGSQKMSDKWYAALTPLLNGGTPLPTSTPAPPTSTPTPLPTNPPGMITVDDSVQGSGQNQFNYVGAAWTHCTNCNEPAPAIFYNASQSWDTASNDNVTVLFTGTQIKYYAVIAPDVGNVGVTMDGGTETLVDLYSATKTGNVLVWTSAVLTSGTHTLKLRNTGSKNANSSGTTITVDRVDIISGPTPTPGPSATPTRTNTPPPASGFVTRSGSHLMLNGSPFYFGGANNYYMLTVPTNEVDSVMNNAHAHGLNVLRVWGYLEGNQGDAHVLQYFTSGHPSYNDGANGFGMMDYMIYKAGQSGERLIITLTNNWAAYGGMDTYVAWRGGGTTHDSFYSDATLIQWYKDYIAHVLNRVNGLNGIAYKNDPTIMAWELANEPRCNGGVSCDATTTAWANTISTYIKSIDTNHLVGSGSEGFFSGGTGNGLPAWLYDGSQGIDEKAMTRLANIDFQSLHLYPDYWGITTAQGTTWITDHVSDSQAAGKAVILGEFGWKNLSQRQSVYDSWTNAIYNNDGAGWLFWVLFGPEESDTEGFTIYCNTTNTDCTTVSNEAALMNAKNGSATATPTRTNTPAPPTNTPTRTNTPVPPTATPTKTNTPVGPTNTPTPTNTPAPPTATPTRTNTPVPPTATPTPTSGTGTTTVDDSVQGTGQNQFNYVGSGWTHCTNCNEPAPAIFYNASQSWDITTNDSVTIAFTGTQIKYYAVKAPDVGIAAVSIDGGAETNVDLYMTPKTGNVLVWTSATLTNGSHTFKVRNTGTKNGSSTGTTITLDRVDILTSAGPTNTPVPPTATPTPSGANLAAGKIATGSTTIGSPAFITDGDKNTANYANIPENPQWIQLDLGQNYNLTQIKVWHYFGDGRTYHDVIVQVSTVSDFSTKTTVFNNDTNNSAGQGTGSQAEYAESSAGKVISFAATLARYVRLWSNGSTINIYNHYVEVEVY